MGIDLDSVVMHKTDICISFFHCNHNDLRTLRSLFSILNSLKLVIFPALLDNRNVSPYLDVECMVGASIHSLLYRPVYSQSISKLVKFHFFNPDSEPHLYFLNLLRTDFVTCCIGFPFGKRKNQVPFFNYILQMPEVIESFNCYCNLPFPSFKGTICDSHSFFAPFISISPSVSSLAFFSISSSNSPSNSPSMSSPASSPNSSSASSSLPSGSFSTCVVSYSLPSSSVPLPFLAGLWLFKSDSPGGTIMATWSGDAICFTKRGSPSSSAYILYIFFEISFWLKVPGVTSRI